VRTHNRSVTATACQTCRNRLIMAICASTAWQHVTVKSLATRNSRHEDVANHDCGMRSACRTQNTTIHTHATSHTTSAVRLLQVL
jgi:hypothetical protein